jgi:hypothetical protein
LNEEKSAESLEKHIIYYSSLSKIIKDMEEEMKLEKEESKIKYLKERINAINLDKKRIEKMFPDNIEDLKNE